jgi:hypothetical protein
MESETGDEIDDEEGSRWMLVHERMKYDSAWCFFTSEMCDSVILSWCKRKITRNQHCIIPHDTMHAKWAVTASAHAVYSFYKICTACSPVKIMNRFKHTNISINCSRFRSHLGTLCSVLLAIMLTLIYADHSISVAGWTVRKVYQRQVAKSGNLLFLNPASRNWSAGVPAVWNHVPVLWILLAVP